MALLSRVAESLFWLGRYVERAENTARLLDVAYHGRFEPTDQGMAGALNTWQALIVTLGSHEEYFDGTRTASEADVVQYLTVSPENGTSIVSSLSHAREAARSVRDFLSSEIWVAVNRLYHGSARADIHLIKADGLYDFCDMVRQGAHLFAGAVDGTALHDEGWQWLRAGLMVERADMVTRIVDSKYHLLLQSMDDVGSPVDRYQWGALLRSVSGYEAFVRTHVGGVETEAVVDFMILNPAFPRSLRACVEALVEALQEATAGADRRPRNAVLKTANGLTNRLRYETVESLLESGLHEFLDGAQIELAAVTDAVSAAFFWSSEDGREQKQTQAS
ncbi:MAG: alpha-E domain-containing protein [Dehalococcoidia bacterium]|nr:alpha-E domain-containing protein [Dehalococcoidia bacterium]MCB9485132.1 alpha-E domain-containing protein [Thermoflexaceae bacterium]